MVSFMNELYIYLFWRASSSQAYKSLAPSANSHGKQKIACYFWDYLKTGTLYKMPSIRKKPEFHEEENCPYFSETDPLKRCRPVNSGAKIKLLLWRILCLEIPLP